MMEKDVRHLLDFGAVNADSSAHSTVSSIWSFVAGTLSARVTLFCVGVSKAQADNSAGAAGDIDARIERGIADPPVQTLRFQGRPAIGLAVSMKGDGDVLELGRNLAAAMERIRSNLPVGIEFEQVSNQPRIVKEAVGTFMKALAEAIAIVLLVSSLVGLIVAYMGAEQLQRVGAQSFIANLVTIGVVREIAALVVGIVLAGRVGAAFAAYPTLNLRPLGIPTRSGAACSTKAAWAADSQLLTTGQTGRSLISR
jgi:hypothetical protein